MQTDSVNLTYPQGFRTDPNFFIHLNTVWLFALLEELVLHPVKKEEMEKFIAEYIVFETAGWKELMNA